MLCKKPYYKGILTYGCGQCLPCRINKRREWVSRLKLERLEHEHACFVTLTYNDEHLPKDLCVEKREAQLFIKRLRKEIYPRKLRYFIVGEYGDKSQRPHYHAILFGVSPTEGITIQQCWPYGFTHTGTAETKSMSYCASYVCKKWTKRGIPELRGRNPEFVLMSRKPGLGAGYTIRAAKAYNTISGLTYLRKQRWIQTTWQTEGKVYPMGRYLRERLIEELGLTQADRHLHNLRTAASISAKNRNLTATQMAEKRIQQVTKEGTYLTKKSRRTF